jgi:CheY-like chemotaxis protein
MENSNSRTALVVESNYLVASVIEAPLAIAGYRVFIATNPAEAFAVLDTEPVELALIDFRLQHAAPEGLVAKLKTMDIPFVFCTAAAVEEVFEHFPDARIVQKPFTEEQLLAAVSGLGSVPAGGQGEECG